MIHAGIPVNGPANTNERTPSVRIRPPLPCRAVGRKLCVAGAPRAAPQFEQNFEPSTCCDPQLLQIISHSFLETSNWCTVTQIRSSSLARILEQILTSKF